MNIEKRDYYVYLLIDPRNNEVFYVGKGIHSRVKQHTYEAKKSNKETDKIKRINDILNSGNKVKEVIYSSRNTEDEAFDKEDELINFFTNNYPGQLTNIQSGHKSIHTMTDEELNDILDNPEQVVFNDNERILFVKRTNNHSWDYKMSPSEHHEEFRGNWVLSKNKLDKIELVCGVYNNIIKYVCVPKEWECVGQRDSRKRKTYEYRFNGDVIKNHKYIGKSIKDCKKMVYNKKTKSYEEKNIFGQGAAIGYLNL